MDQNGQQSDQKQIPQHWFSYWTSAPPQPPVRPQLLRRDSRAPPSPSPSQSESRRASQDSRAAASTSKGAPHQVPKPSQPNVPLVPLKQETPKPQVGADTTERKPISSRTIRTIQVDTSSEASPLHQVDETSKKISEEPKKSHDKSMKIDEEPKKRHEKSKKIDEEPKKGHDKSKKVDEEPRKSHEKSKKDDEEPKKSHKKPKETDEEPKKSHKKPKDIAEEPKRSHEKPEEILEESKKSHEKPKEKSHEESKESIEKPKKSHEKHKEDVEDTKKSHKEHGKLHKEINAGIGDMMQKIATLQPAGHGGDERGTSIIKFAGKNKGASMKVSREEGKSHGRKLSDAAAAEGGEGAAARGKGTVAVINSNVQLVNNSLLFQSSCTGGDPGVHVKLSSKSKKKEKLRRGGEEGGGGTTE